MLDDVAVEDTSGEVEAVQVKSALKTNPISNRSVELWKTVANWMKAVENKELEIGTTVFHLRLGHKRSGAICESFAQASSASIAREAAQKAKGEFFSTTGKLRKGISSELAEAVESVFSAGRSTVLEGIIQSFQFSCGSTYAYEELLNRLKTKFIDEDIAEDVLLHALGWVKKELDNAVERDQSPSISVDKFRKEINAFRDRLKSRSYLPSFAGTASLEQIELHRLRVFVRQLNLIRFSEEQVLRGITDFLSAVANRVEYAQRGYVHSQSFEEFEQALQSLWLNHRDEVELNKNEDEITRGQRLAYRCFRESPKLQGIATPADFVRGCFHSLADLPSIGWHPRYEALLAKPESADGQA